MITVIPVGLILLLSLLLNIKRCLLKLNIMKRKAELILAPTKKAKKLSKAYINIFFSFDYNFFAPLFHFHSHPFPKPLSTVIFLKGRKVYTNLFHFAVRV